MTAPVHERAAFDEATIRAVICRALDSLPLAVSVDNITSSLAWHTEQQLLPAVAAKDWAAHGQHELVALITGEVRKRLGARPAPGASAAARAVYCQELARTCRAFLALALAEPGDEQRLREAQL
ncbi:DUF6415 family natural product biosynthesis protein [Streptomyces hesseae]|uniref:DUF6415 family natural product biosynthesis protein n=1 Tax=Streptomyces hesseae TaxID=3075519 RepID=A0ABU2SZF4_9ACTN|nr:DUF6415 family natural product biosynthesis protein [Streptomyces sp. DSM 40473]MDT0453754.1 DUF6415 family natural product biosynthesis protein [Streptomyces sp. DSM 40473]